MNEDYAAMLRKLTPGELVLELENAVIDLCNAVIELCNHHGEKSAGELYECVRLCRREIVGRLVIGR